LDLLTDRSLIGISGFNAMMDLGRLSLSAMFQRSLWVVIARELVDGVGRVGKRRNFCKKEGWVAERR